MDKVTPAVPGNRNQDRDADHRQKGTNQLREGEAGLGYDIDSLPDELGNEYLAAAGHDKTENTGEIMSAVLLDQM